MNEYLIAINRVKTIIANELVSSPFRDEAMNCLLLLDDLVIKEIRKEKKDEN